MRRQLTTCLTLIVLLKSSNLANFPLSTAFYPVLRLNSSQQQTDQIKMVQSVILALLGLSALLAARCLPLLLVKSKYRSKTGRVKTMIVLGSGWCRANAAAGQRSVQSVAHASSFTSSTSSTSNGFHHHVCCRWPHGRDADADGQPRQAVLLSPGVCRC